MLGFLAPETIISYSNNKIFSQVPNETHYETVFVLYTTLYKKSISALRVCRPR